MATIRMTVPSEYDTTGVQHYTIHDFRFHAGVTATVHIAYREWHRGVGPTVLIPTCYGGRINDTLNFTTGALHGRHVVVAAMLGNGESSSPSNTPDFPVLDYRDCVNAQYALLKDGLGVSQVEAVIGFSMGGQQAYYWTQMYPTYISSAVAICSSARTSAHNYAFLAGPAAALRNSIDFPDYKTSGKPPVKGIAAFGQAWGPWGLSSAWFREGHWRGNAATPKTIAEWVRDDAAQDFQDWDAANLLVLLEMWQNGDIGSFREDGDFKCVLKDTEIPILVMPCRTDAYFDFRDSETEAEHLKSPSRLEIIESVWGHVAGAGLNPADAKWMDERIEVWVKERAEDESRHGGIEKVTNMIKALGTGNQ